MPVWRPILPNSEIARKVPHIARMDAGLADTRDAAIRGHLAVSSLNTYQTGLTAWDQFADQYKIPQDIFQLDQLAILMTVEFFACYLRKHRHVKSTTIDKYITHVSTNLREKGLPDSTNLRCKRLGYILESFAKEDSRALPQRLSIKIPLTADLLWRLEIFIDASFPNSPIATLYKAAFSLGYLIGLRPGEYLSTPTRRLHSRLLREPVSTRRQRPSLRFQMVFIRLPVHCNKPTWLSARSSRSSVCHDPLEQGRSTRERERSLWSFLSERFKDFARSVDLDPNRLLPHSIPVGTSVQTDALTDIDQMQLTGHISKGGKLAHCRRTLALAKRAAPFLHDTAVQPLDQIRFLYM